MYQIFLIHIVFQIFDIVKVGFSSSVIKIAFNFKSRGTKKIELSSKGTYNFQILGINNNNKLRSQLEPTRLSAWYKCTKSMINKQEI